MKRLLFFSALCALLVVGPVTASLPHVPAAAQGNYDVTIIVADDFSGTDLNAIDTGQFDAADNCAVSLEGQAYAVRGVAADPIDEAHGDLVFEQLEALLDAAGAGDAIGLVAVDIQGASTDVVADRIADAIADHDSDFYILNMSFALIPCEMIDALAEFGGQLMSAREAKDLNRYRGQFQRAVLFYDKTVFPVMSQRAQDADDLDPLQALLEDLGSSVIPVASAGNFGLDFPFWPGAWGQVISVSASVGAGYHAPSAWDKKNDTPLLDAEGANPNQRMRVSNYGEVMLPGEYASDYGPVSGTSFAAPRLSVALALYVSEVGGNYCRQPDGDPALAHGGWDNLTLVEAVEDFCPAMGPYLP